MKLSELGMREIIDISRGTRHGGPDELDLLFDEFSGKIRALQIPDGGRRIGMFGAEDLLEIPWKDIRKIGEDLIVVETDHSVNW